MPRNSQYRPGVSVSDLLIGLFILALVYDCGMALLAAFPAHAASFSSRSSFSSSSFSSRSYSTSSYSYPAPRAPSSVSAPRASAPGYTVRSTTYASSYQRAPSVPVTPAARPPIVVTHQVVHVYAPAQAVYVHQASSSSFFHDMLMFQWMSGMLTPRPVYAQGPYPVRDGWVGPGAAPVCRHHWWQFWRHQC